MHSSYKISNSSDTVPLQINSASVLKVQSDKKSEELKFFIESSLRVGKLSANPEDEVSLCAENTENLSIEPHSFNLFATPLSQELLLAEELLRSKEIDKLPTENVDSADSDNEPLSAHIERRRMFGAGKSNKPNVRDPGKLAKVDQPVAKPDSKQIFRRSQLEKQKALLGTNERRSFDGNNTGVVPTLPQTPVPVTDLQTAQIRSSPIKAPSVNPLLQSLKPIPQHPEPPVPDATSVARSRPGQISVNVPPISPPKPGAKPDLISIQVPMAGPDGSQTMQTINIPRSVLAGASDRPILLTVTPKNGVNKGQKQIVVLTRNNSGQTSATCHVPRPSTSVAPITHGHTSVTPVSQGHSPAKSIQLSPRAGMTHVSQEASGTPRQSPAQQVIRGQIVQTSTGKVLVQGNKQIPLGNNVLQNGKLVLSQSQLAALQGGGGSQTTRIVTGTGAGIRGPGAGGATRSVITGAQLQNMMSSGQKIVSLGTNANGQQIVRVLSNNSSPSTPQRHLNNLPTHQQQSTPRQVLQQNGILPATPSTPPTPATPTSQGATASLSRILTALHNRGLVSQQNGKFYYVGDKTKSPVSLTSLTPGTAAKLASSQGIAISSPTPKSSPLIEGASAASNSIPGITSLNRAQHQHHHHHLQHQSPASAAVVVAPAANLDSFTADSDMMMMATSFMNNTSVSSNGDTSSIPSSQPLVETTSDRTESFCYKDRALPPGWYIKINKKQVAEFSYEVETSFFSPEGARLQTQEQVQAYMTGQLSVDTCHLPPMLLSQMPWKEELSEIDLQLVPSIEVVAQQMVGGVIKRTSTAPGDGVLEKKFKPDNNGVLYA